MEDYLVETRRIDILVELFVVVSGLQINHVNSSFIPFGMADEEAEGCPAELRTLIGSLLISYLHLPPVGPTHSITWVDSVIECMENRL